MATARVERRLAAILAADVVGYSRLMERDDTGTLERLKAHRKELLEPLLAEHRGRIVKLTGDGVLCEFASVVDAVACAVAIQQGMARREQDVPEAERIRFRIGVNLGDIIVEGEDIYGDGVNIAARLEGLADPGGVCVSGKVREELRKRLELAFAPMGQQRVKNIAEPVETWRVVLEGRAGRPQDGPGRGEAPPGSRRRAGAGIPRSHRSWLRWLVVVPHPGRG
jgi:class 3 adenylate cyclase